MIESGFAEKTKMLLPAGYIERKDKLKVHLSNTAFKKPTIAMEHGDATKIIKNAFKKRNQKNKRTC